MKKYILDEDGNELTGVIGCNEEGYIFEEEWFQENVSRLLAEWLTQDDLGGGK